jgi:hypothetical protein
VDQFNSVGRRVCVIGAGIAGLVTAKVLRDVTRFFELFTRYHSPNRRRAPQERTDRSMNDAQVRLITGSAGVAIGTGSLVALPLYFMYSGPPPDWNVFTRGLVGLITCAFLIVFIAGLSHLIRRADAGYEWIASLVYAAGMLFVAVSLVAISLEAGVIFGAPHGGLDPTIDGTLAEGNILIHGSIKRMLTVVLLVSAGYAVLRTRMLPGWLGGAAYFTALFNLVFVPSMYFGKDASRFYSAIGWGNSAFCASFLAYWILAVGITMLRQRSESIYRETRPRLG